MRSHLALWLAASTLAASLTVASLETPAWACGGCFHSPEPASENNTVVTDHRMVLSIDLQQSTLYDQIRYQGNPESFAWVLPIRGTATVGVSADAVFSVLDANTAVQVKPPPMNCPPPDCVGSGSGCGASTTGASADNAGESGNRGVEDAGVSVLKQETVGPYETVQLRSSDPDALGAWLAKNGYTIPPEVQPIVAAYIKDQFDFLAVKLVPGKGVRAMVPIRVTTPGASPQLPLRMVAAGTGAMVGITLWIVAEGRWEPQNFPTFTIPQDELVWDWVTSSSNFKALRAKKTTQFGASAWEQESSADFATTSLRTQIFSQRSTSLGGAPLYQPVKDGNGNIVRTSEQAMDDDFNVLFGLRRSSVRISRIRADLPKESLATDLSLQASADQSVLAVVRTVTKEANEPQCPVYDGCTVLRQGTRSEAILAVGREPGSLSGGGCSTRRAQDYCGGFGLVVAAAAVGMVRRRARKARENSAR